jgi:hypothetical protein
VYALTGSAFGLNISSELALPGLTGEHETFGHPLAIGPGQVGEPGADAELLWETRFDGLDFALHRSADGAYWFTYGDEARFHLSTDALTLTCDVRELGAPGWQRLLLDTVLWATAYLRGLELLHASAVEVEGRTIAFASITGGGKTSLALALLERGATLVCDDIVALSAGGRLVAHPGPGLMNVSRRRGRSNELGERLAVFGEEEWVETRERASGPRELAAIFLLSRGGPDTDIRRVAATALDLIAHSVCLPAGIARRRSQFLVFSRIANEVPVYRCQASAELAPEPLAEAVEGHALGRGALEAVHS